MSRARPRATLPYAAARGPAAGAVCALGAVVAHAVAGGVVALPAVALAVAVSVALGAWLLRGPVDGWQTFALALAAQVVWHGAFLVTAGVGPDHSALGMLATHGLAAAGTAVVALGVERELVLLACRRCALVLPTLAAVVPPRPVPAPVVALAGPVPAVRPHLEGRVLRGPPR